MLNVFLSAALLVTLSATSWAQTQKPSNPTPAAPANRAPAPASSTLPSDYVIGVEDALTVVFWREKDMSADVVVRPDGKISLPMLNDVVAAGLTPEQLGDALTKAGSKFVRDSNATVMVREIRSRKIYIIGEVGKPGTFQLGSDMTVLQALGEAGGFVEGAKKNDVVIVRKDGNGERRFKFSYDDVVKGKNLAQNIKLVPGDTIIVR